MQDIGSTRHMWECVTSLVAMYVGRKFHGEGTNVLGLGTPEANCTLYRPWLREHLICFTTEVIQ